MKLKTLGIASLFACLMAPALQSCLDDDDKKYSQLTIGTIEVIEGKDYYFSLDAGGKMYPGDTTQINNYPLKSDQRTFVYFDLLDEKVPGYDYNAIIYRIENILTKDIVRVPSEESEKNVGNDRINITNLWITGDYLNIQYQLYYDEASDKKHLLNVILKEQTDLADGGDYLTLEFRHNAFNEKENKLGSGLVSFKLEKIKELLAGKKGINIRYHSLYEGMRTKSVDIE